MANIERRNALYSSLYEDTHDLNTGGFSNNEAGQLYKSTGNTTDNYIADSARASGHTVKQGSHGGLLFGAKKDQERSEWGQKYAERKGIKNPLADSAINNGATPLAPYSGKDSTDPDVVANGKRQDLANMYFEKYHFEPPLWMDEDQIMQQLGVTSSTLYGDRVPDAVQFAQQKGQAMNDYFAQQDSNRAAAKTVAENGERQDLANQYFERYGVEPPLYMDVDDIKQYLGAGNEAQEAADLANERGRTLTEKYRTQAANEAARASALDAGARENSAYWSTRPDFERMEQLRLEAERNKALNSVQEDTLMGDTYPDMQTASGYKGSDLPLDHQRLMYTDPLRTVTPGREGGQYKAADGSITPLKQEVDDAYAQYMAQSSGGNGGIAWDVTRGADDQEDRKYSYSPGQSYNSQTAIADAINQWQQNKGARNALGAQTFNSDQQYQALYNELLTKGLSKEDIMSMSGGEELPGLTPEQNMMLYYYAMNH